MYLTKPDYPVCKNCGEKLPLKPIQVQVKKGIRQYCSEDCALKWHSKYVVRQAIYPTTTRI